MVLFLLTFALIVGLVAAGLAASDGASVPVAACWFGGAVVSVMGVGVSVLMFLRS
jgi:hypothetical protein